MSPSALLEIEEKAQELVPLAAVRGLVDRILALDVTSWEDDDFEELERIIDQLLSLLSVPPIPPERRPIIEQLLEARAGVEQGVAPDPAKRPTAEEMRANVAAHR